MAEIARLQKLLDEGQSSGDADLLMRKNEEVNIFRHLATRY